MGPTATTRRPVEDPAAMTSEIKSRARALGAGLVGVTRIKPGYVYQGHEVPYRNAIAIGVVMDRGKMKEVPGVVSGTEVMRIYAEVGRIASQLSEEIRAMGWPARAYGNPNSGDLLHIPISVDAGFGQLGKHGSLISREYGSNFRLGTIVTDLPLQADQPVDIAVDDLHAVQSLRPRVSGGCDLRRKAAGTRRREVVRGLRQMHLLFHRDRRLRDLHRGVPLE